MYNSVCPDCGAALDPGEKCTCREHDPVVTREVYVSTSMVCLPACCARCGFNKLPAVGSCGSCIAIPWRMGLGKPLAAVNEEEERAPWCPLRLEVASEAKKLADGRTVCGACGAEIKAAGNG